MNSTPPIARVTYSSVLATHGTEPNSGAAAAPAPARWQQPLAELEEFKRALASSQQQLQAARQEIEVLAASNLRHRRKLIRLAREIAQARHFAYYDELTGLPNRRLLLDRLNQAMAQGARQHKQVALLLLDLDGFKSVNDALSIPASLLADRGLMCDSVPTAGIFGANLFL